MEILTGAETRQSYPGAEKKSFFPFESGMDADADAVMVSHLILTNVTDEKEPCSLRAGDIRHPERRAEYEGPI